MTTLTITPKISDKTARFRGTVAAGEHVAVTIKGGAEWLGDDNGAHLSLRVLDLVTGRTLALFPRPEETLGDDDEPDAWSVSAEDPDDLFCNLNLNTDRMVNAARHMLHVPVLFVMGAKDDENPATTRTLYFRDRYEVEFWPERVGDDTPYDLDRWPKQIDEWTDLVAEFGTRLATAETNISQAESRVNAAINAIPQTVQTAVAQINSGKADKVANATGGNLAALDANGNLDDSGKKPADFADAAQFAAHKDNTTIHITATERSTWNAKYDKPSGGIPKSDLAAAVQTSLGKADSAIQEHQSLAACVNGGVYDGDAKKILLKHDSVTVAEIDATAFIKDGMISEVKIVGDNLVIVFNADAGKESISIPLTQIFNPANFYDKTAADGRFVQKEAGKGLSSNDYTTEEKQKLAGVVAGANNYTLPAATASTLGGVKQGTGVTIADDGTISVTGGGGGGGSDDALTRNEATSGFTRWNVEQDGFEIQWNTDTSPSQWTFYNSTYGTIETGSTDINATFVYAVTQGGMITALRTRLPTMADVDAKLDKTGGTMTGGLTVSAGVNNRAGLEIVNGEVFLTENHEDGGRGASVRYLLEQIYSIPYALVDATPTYDGAPFVLAACFPIKYVDEDISEAHTVQLSDISHITVALNDTSGKYEMFDSGFSAVDPVCLINADGTYYSNSSDVDNVTFGVNDDPAVAGTTQVLGFTPTYALTDRAINAVSLTADASLVFPAKTDGKARDFVVRLTLTETGGTVPSVTFPADVAYETDGGEWPDLTEAGTYIVRLTEVPTVSESETARLFLQCSSAVADATPPSAGGGQ